MEKSLDDVIVQELDSLYRFAFSRTRDAYKAEDITQNIVLRAYQAYPRLRDKSKVRSWLWGIANNVILQSFKEQREIAMDEVAIIHMAGVSYETPESEFLRKSDILQVRKAVSFLAKNYRDVCVLYYLEGKDYETIARELQIPLSSVKWRLNQSKSQLQKELVKMDYMENGYRKAVPLYFNMGGWVGNPKDGHGNYDGADEALSGLLPQNICISAYKKPKTVTEIASDLGVAADYVEDHLKKLVETQSVKQIGNKYQTMFPIWDVETVKDIYEGNRALAAKMTGKVVDLIYSLAEEIKAIGFHGADKDMDKLILFLCGFVSDQGEYNRFEVEKLPFTGIDKAWYIQAQMDSQKSILGEKGHAVGINTNGIWSDLTEYYFAQKYTVDNRSQRPEERKAFYSLYLGEAVTDEPSLAALVESGKVRKTENGYQITVPVISREKGEWEKLKQVLSPVFEKTNALQKAIYDRSMQTVKKYMPRHLAEQADFFGGLCSHGTLELMLFMEIDSRNIPITQEMATWFRVK